MKKIKKNFDSVCKDHFDLDYNVNGVVVGSKKCLKCWSFEKQEIDSNGKKVVVCNFNRAFVKK
jgi:hypothetical protein